MAITEFHSLHWYCNNSESLVATRGCLKYLMRVEAYGYIATEN